jgi:hypothetical protein
MKRKMVLLICLVALIVPAGIVLAAGTCTQVASPWTPIGLNYGGGYIITFTCTGDATDGSFPATAISTANMDLLRGLYLYYLVVTTGTVKPTNLWDMTMTIKSGTLDILGGTGIDRGITIPEEIYPKIGSSGFPKPAYETITLNITGNSVNSAAIVIDAIFAR